MTDNQPNFILIDGSYFIFYRYFAILSWFKLAKKDQIIDKDNPPEENKEFINKFVKTFHTKLTEIPKKLKINKSSSKPIMLVGRDCPRQDIWRMDLLKTYKANRVYDDTFLGGPFFKKAYNDNLFQKGGAKTIFRHPKLEADDCLAILTKIFYQNILKQIFILLLVIWIIYNLHNLMFHYMI